MNELVQQSDGLAVAVSNGIQQMTLAEIDQQVATSKRYPRNINRFRSNVIAEATISQAVAESMVYALPVGGDKVETGPSIRLAEIVASQYGNLLVQGRIVDIGDRTVTAQGVAWDMESNFKVSVEVTESIVKKDGSRYQDRMVKNVCNSAISKAYRNAVFRVIPRSTVDWFIEQLDKNTLCAPEQVAEKRASAIIYLKDKYQIPEANILNFVGKKSVDEIGAKDLNKIRAGLNSIKDGHSTALEMFQAPEVIGNQKEEVKEKPKEDALKVGKNSAKSEIKEVSGVVEKDLFKDG